MLEPILREARVRVVALAESGPEEPLRQSREAGRVRREIDERDRASAHRQRDAVGQMALHRVVEADDPLAREIGQQRRREHLRDRADLEDRPLVGRVRAVVTHSPPPERDGHLVDRDADRDPDVLTGALVEHALDSHAELVGRERHTSLPGSRETPSRVEPAGLEPATFWLPARRSPN